VKIEGQVTTNRGRIENVVAQPNPESGGWRLTFELYPDGEPAELRAQLIRDGKPVSEVWIYRWTA
jgi:glucans biosynthesis protein